MSTGRHTTGLGGFNPRAREGRDRASPPSRRRAWVSIHAPARGATRPRGPARRSRSCFNPRAREGRDLAPVAGEFAQKLVSIHAPARGATHRHPRKREAAAVSIHAPARGATSARSFCVEHSSFQSTRPRGARRLVFREEEYWDKFQSTRPRGARRTETRQPRSGAVFQSTRPRGARPGRRWQGPRMEPVSIHAPARGATVSNVYTVTTDVFQSTRPRGARLVTPMSSSFWDTVSIHAPARGATFLHDLCLGGGVVSIHAPARGATKSPVRG